MRRPKVSRLYRALFLCAAVIVFPWMAASQTRGEAIARAVDIAGGNYERLIRTRGLETPAGARASSPDASWIEASLLRNYPAGTGVMLYVCERQDCDSIKGWLIIPREKIDREFDLRISASDLGEATQHLRDAILRVPAGVRGAVLTDVESSDAPALPAAVTRATGLMLPREVASRMKDLRHLVVVPASAIGTVPFALLEPFADGRALIEQMTISIAPSIADLRTAAPAWRGRFEKPLIVGAPALPAEYAPLPGAAEEARRVAELLNTRALTGKEATLARVAETADVADLLYFATHGLARPEDPLEGYLAFAGDSHKNIALTARTIQANKLAARLAVLSACQTGLGKTHDAGIIGLARAFQIGGVPRVVMSLWNVNDAGTVDLMVSFIRHTREQVPAEALRLAMLEARTAGKPASVWAAFVLFGTNR